MAAADIVGAGSAVVGALGGIFFASKDAKERRQLEEKIAKLTLDQQKELATKQLEVQTDLEKMRILYQYLAVVKNNDALAVLDKKKYTSYIILGTGLIALGIVIIIARKQNANG